MSKLLTLFVIPVAVLLLPQAAQAAGNDTFACTVSVEYTLNNVSTLTYVRAFQVGPTAPYSEDFSTATRFRFFDASVADVGGVPVVSIIFDADVSVFNTVDFGAKLKVRDRNGESTSGDNAFFTSGPTGGSAHRTNWSLSCSRARN
jgi:hypothetical protein